MRTIDTRTADAAATTILEASPSCGDITLTNSRARRAIQGPLVSPHLDEPFVHVVQHLQSTIGAPDHA